MHIDAFDQYQESDSLVHRLDPRVKVVVTALFILSNALLPDGAWAGFLIAFGLIALVAILARLELWRVVKRSFIALPFALAAVTIAFAAPGPPLFSFALGPWEFTVTVPGATRFLSILLRSLLSVQMAILLTMTTPFPDLIHAFRHLRLPHSLVAIIAFMYRYLFVLSDEALRLLRARAARTARLDDRAVGGSVLWRARVTGNMAGQLFVRSFERSDRVYNAMLARGYQGHLYTLSPHEMSGFDWAALGFFALALLALQIFARIG
ncbi:MAG: cobalt ECF transporter T component CbiQ [Chloroflexi bacterium]|nr:cobalt ECF transporter T component CbiQ [Chloroflexota bacterium]